MNFTFENHGTNTYLVYSVKEDDLIDTLSLGMLTNNKIPALATAFFTQLDSDKFIKYNISSKISAQQFFEGAVNKKRLLGVFKGIVNALLSAEEYMIDERSVILDLDYIFADVSTCETTLICLPIQNATEMCDLSMFFKTIMFNKQFDQTENCDYVTRILNYLNSTPRFSLNDFKELLDLIEEVKFEATKVVSVKPVEAVPTPASQPQPVVHSILQKTPQKEAVSPVKEQKAETIPVPPQTMGGVPVPPKVQNLKLEPKAAGGEKEEKQISWLYLMQHYNKENATAYKAQKEAKKNGGKGSQTPPKPTKVKRKNVRAQNKTLLEVPGRNGVVNYQIPGQSSVTTQSNEQVQPVEVSPQQVVNQILPQQQVQPTAQPAVQQTTQAETTPAYVPREEKINFGQTTVLGLASSGETTALNVANAANRVALPYLVRIKNNEKISLNKPVFRIGKEKSYVDYFIGDNTAVSRSHANIITRDGEFFVVDTNSTNHTFVNGNMISSSVEVKIEHGVKLMFGNEEFEFKLY